MDQESKIAAELASKLPKPEPIPTGYPEPDKPEDRDEGLHNSLPLEGSQMIGELTDYFNLGIGARHNGETSAQLSEILTWARQNAESNDLPGILRVMRHTEVILGSSLKPDRLARIYRYVRIQQQKAVIAERERSLYV